MDKAQALYSFWSSFDLDAIDEQSSYDEQIMDDLGISYPYITYETGIADIFTPVTLAADIWYKSTSWSAAEAKAAQIWDYIGLGGCKVRYDNGVVWIKRDAPYRRMEAGTYDVRRIHFDIVAEFQSA